jgi:hypothetical protein
VGKQAPHRARAASPEAAEPAENGVVS